MCLIALQSGYKSALNVAENGVILSLPDNAFADFISPFEEHRMSHYFYCIIGENVIRCKLVGSDLTIYLFERYSIPFSPDSFVPVPYSAGDSHIYFGIMR